MTTEASISITDLRKIYATRDGALTSLDGVTFDIRPREFVSVLGPSGSGKTTVLKIVAGLEKKTSGDVRVDGKEVTGPQRKIGIVFQVPALMRWRTALENILLPSEVLGIDKTAARERERSISSVWATSPTATRTNCGGYAAAHFHRPRARTRSIDSAAGRTV
jgi:NitT/TauT family transport system ATP-binding protein